MRTPPHTSPRRPCLYRLIMNLFIQLDVILIKHKAVSCELIEFKSLQNIVSFVYVLYYVNLCAMRNRETKHWIYNKQRFCELVESYVQIFLWYSYLLAITKVRYNFMKSGAHCKAVDRIPPLIWQFSLVPCSLTTYQATTWRNKCSDDFQCIVTFYQQLSQLIF